MHPSACPGTARSPRVSSEPCAAPRRATIFAAVVAVSAAGAWGGAALAPRADAVVVARHQHVDRHSARTAFFRDGGVIGQIAVDYGSAKWSSELQRAFDATAVGERVRLGSNFWTTLDTHVPVAIGDVELEPDAYYCALQRGEGEVWNLVLMPSDAVRRERKDAFFSHETRGGHLVPMARVEAAEPSADLTITLVPNDAADEVALTITLGPHELREVLRPRF